MLPWPYRSTPISLHALITPPSPLLPLLRPKWHLLTLNQMLLLEVRPILRSYHLLRQHADVDLVVYAAVGLENEVAGGLHKLVGTIAEEEVRE